MAQEVEITKQYSAMRIEGLSFGPQELLFWLQTSRDEEAGAAASTGDGKKRRPSQRSCLLEKRQQEQLKTIGQGAKRPYAS
ncbi:hypothetical protein T265_07778 [Opisthorchis viverrini]|uniref:Uncharacterized protein n=1 Tax=Opisthorchis viverrini TaxID=6198 RepID=A0A074ZMJ4_OPIVI|nr:hypothetical protein T265_07778 [Opisthorchis viverrini]KER24580.1 hypothetical protein T265_07778 [Opisthorchis viverrini]